MSRSATSCIETIYVTAGSDDLSSSARTALETETLSAIAEMNRIAASTSFNGKTLIDDVNGKSFTFYVGSGVSTSETITVTINGVNWDLSGGLIEIGSATETVDPVSGELLASTSAIVEIDDIDRSITALALERTSLGGAVNRLQSVYENIQAEIQNAIEADSVIRDADFAAEASALSRDRIIIESGASLVAQTTQLPQSALILLT